MGWITLPTPGTKYGPCKGKCKHTDCAATRTEAETPCRYCKKPIGFDTKFYTDRDETKVGGGTLYSHFVCAHKARADEIAKAEKDYQPVFRLLGL